MTMPSGTGGSEVRPGLPPPAADGRFVSTGLDGLDAILGGLRLGDNSKAALLTRALAEMVRVGTALGAQPETFYGLSGFGDLVATCYGG